VRGRPAVEETVHVYSEISGGFVENTVAFTSRGAAMSHRKRNILAAGYASLAEYEKHVKDGVMPREFLVNEAALRRGN